MARRRHNLDGGLSANLVSHIQDILEKMQKLSDKAGRLATHAPQSHPWIREYLQEIADKIDDLGERFEEELEENGILN